MSKMRLLITFCVGVIVVGFGGAYLVAQSPPRTMPDGLQCHGDRAVATSHTFPEGFEGRYSTGEEAARAEAKREGVTFDQTSREPDHGSDRVRPAPGQEHREERWAMTHRGRVVAVIDVVQRGDGWATEGSLVCSER
jgi:hypothetical protein